MYACIVVKNVNRCGEEAINIHIKSIAYFISNKCFLCAKYVMYKNGITNNVVTKDNIISSHEENISDN